MRLNGSTNQIRLAEIEKELKNSTKLVEVFNDFDTDSFEKETD